jgi:excisionase family DNA binding protein
MAEHEADGVADDDMVDVITAADRLGISVSLVEKLLAEGALRGAKQNGRWLIPESALPERS